MLTKTVLDMLEAQQQTGEFSTYKDENKFGGWEMCSLYPCLKYAHAPKVKVNDNRMFVSFGNIGDSFAVVALYDKDNRLLNPRLRTTRQASRLLVVLLPQKLLSN